MTKQPLLLLPFCGLIFTLVCAVFLELSALFIRFSFFHSLLHPSILPKTSVHNFCQPSCGKVSPRVHCANFCFALSALFGDVSRRTGIFTQAVTDMHVPVLKELVKLVRNEKVGSHCVCVLFSLRICIAFADMCKKKESSFCFSDCRVEEMVPHV